jgi:hypothetical protein
VSWDRSVLRVKEPHISVAYFSASARQLVAAAELQGVDLADHQRLRNKRVCKP